MEPITSPVQFIAIPAVNLSTVLSVVITLVIK